MTKRNSIEVCIYGNRGEHYHSFPARWVICPACEGHAVTTRHIEPEGGGFTASEWQEACDDDPGFDGEEGFAEKYFGGFYDRKCFECDGLGRVQQIDREAITGRWQLKLLAEYDRQIRDHDEILAMEAAERRMGA